MKKIIEKENKLIFSSEMDNTLVNAIRRYVNQIPTVTVDDVEIMKNDSALYDEALAHRIGLIPLKVSKKNGELKLKSKKEGFVYSGELSGDAKIVYEKIPLTFLNKDQELELKANLKSGTGSEHSKFSPGIIFFREVNEITGDKKFKEDIEIACTNVEIKESGNKIIIIDNKENEISDVCEGIFEKEGVVLIKNASFTMPSKAGILSSN